MKTIYNFQNISGINGECVCTKILRLLAAPTMVATTTLYTVVSLIYEMFEAAYGYRKHLINDWETL